MVSRARWDSSTSNLGRHIEKDCHAAPPEGQRIEDFAHGSTYTKHRMRYLLALWCARRHRPYLIIQDPELLAIFRMLYSKVQVPHPTTLSKDVQEVYEISRRNLISLLKVRRVLMLLYYSQLIAYR